MKNIFIIAEVSANHNNDFNLAKKTIQAIADAGADAVKVQTYKPESLTLNLDTGYFAKKKEGLWKGYTPWKLYSQASMPYEWQPKLKKAAEDLGLIFFSSPFDLDGVDFLESMDCPIYKIASFEITDIPLIEHAASKGKPMIISTGVANIQDIELAIETCRNIGNHDITILKCTSQYPAQISDANLATIPDMIKRFGVKVGVSDHTMGSLVPTVAVSLGATVVEKHFILDRNLGGPDSSFSMEPHEFKEMISEVRKAHKTIGNIHYVVAENDKLRRRSLFVTKDLKKNTVFSKDNIRSIRPGYGLHPKHLPDLLGRKANKDIQAGTPLSWDMIQ